MTRSLLLWFSAAVDHRNVAHLCLRDAWTWDLGHEPFYCSVSQQAFALLWSVKWGCHQWTGLAVDKMLCGRTLPLIAVNPGKQTILWKNSSVSWGLLTFSNFPLVSEMSAEAPARQPTGCVCVRPCVSECASMTLQRMTHSSRSDAVWTKWSGTAVWVPRADRRVSALWHTSPRLLSYS